MRERFFLRMTGRFGWSALGCKELGVVKGTSRSSILSARCGSKIAVLALLCTLIPATLEPQSALVRGCDVQDVGQTIASRVDARR